MTGEEFDSLIARLGAGHPPDVVARRLVLLMRGMIDVGGRPCADALRMMVDVTQRIDERGGQAAIQRGDRPRPGP